MGWDIQVNRHDSIKEHPNGSTREITRANLSEYHKTHEMINDSRDAYTKFIWVTILLRAMLQSVALWYRLELATQEGTTRITLARQQGSQMVHVTFGWRLGRKTYQIRLLGANTATMRIIVTSFVLTKAFECLWNQWTSV